MNKLIVGLDHPFGQMGSDKNVQVSRHSGERRNDVVAETMINAQITKHG